MPRERADAAAPSPGARGRRGQAGFSLVEALVATLLTLTVMLGLLQLMDASKRSHVRVLELAEVESTGRAALEFLVGDAAVAGYDPLGAGFFPAPQGDANTVQLLADLDGDGVVGTAGEDGENITYQFLDPDGDGLYELRRGVDLDGDGDFGGSSESADTLATRVVPIDVDGDGTAEPFLAYDQEPPVSQALTIAFGIRADSDLLIPGQSRIRRFSTGIVMRNPRF